MPGLTNYAENIILNWIANGGDPGTLTPYVGLHTADPLDDGSVSSEVTTTIRPGGRITVSFGNTPVTNAGANTVANDAIADFGTAAGAVADITHFAIYDAASAGNRLMVGTITGAPIDVNLGAAVTFQIGQLVLSMN